MADRLVGVSTSDYLLPAPVLNALADQVGSPTSTIGAAVRDILAVVGTWANVKDFGALGDGVNDDLPAFQSALSEAATVFVPAGTYLLGGELKLPSDSSLIGAGIDVTILRSASTVPRYLNTVTNASNTRQARTVYDEHIRVADLTIDGNYEARPSGGGEWAGNASCLMLSTVRQVVIERVRAHDAPLHCFAVDASYLPDEAEVTPELVVPGPSQNVVLRDCVAYNSHVDDGFTSHYSSEILFDRCVAIRDIPPNPAGGVNNGFEVDDGSYRVTIRDCYARGWQSGVQVKGHAYAAPSKDVVIDRVVAEGCAVGFTLSGSASINTPSLAGRASNVVLRDCECVSPIILGDEGNLQTAVKIYAYENVRVENFVSRDSPTGGIIIHQSGKVVIDGVRGEDVWNGENLTSDGFIRTTGEAFDEITVKNVNILTPVTGPIFRNNQTAEKRMSIRGVIAQATTGSFPVVSDTYLTPYRQYDDIRGTGFSKQIEIRGGSGAASDLQSYGVTTRGPGDPEGVVVGWPGYLYLSMSGGLWVKTAGVSSTGWKQVTL